VGSQRPGRKERFERGSSQGVVRISGGYRVRIEKV
jgi:hypothetical protein